MRLCTKELHNYRSSLLNFPYISKKSCVIDTGTCTYYPTIINTSEDQIDQYGKPEQELSVHDLVCLNLKTL